MAISDLLTKFPTRGHSCPGAAVTMMAESG